MAAQQVGVISATRGEVFARNPEGQIRRLAVGDPVLLGDVIVTSAGGAAEMTPFNGAAINIGEQQSVTIDASVVSGVDAVSGALSPLSAAEAARVIQPPVAAGNSADINALLEQEATAAGLTGGNGSEGSHSFVNLLRIAEATNPANFDFPANPPGTAPQINGAGGAAPVVAAAQQPAAPEPTPAPTTPTLTTPTPTPAPTTPEPAPTAPAPTTPAPASNSAPIFASPALANVAEDEQPTTASRVTATDANGDPLSYSGGGAGGHGVLTINPNNGEWLYTLDNNSNQNLAKGETRTDIFVVTVTDNQGATATTEIVVTITGTNDVPVITSDVGHGRVLEDEVLTTRGVIASSDIDNNSVLTYSGNSDSPMGQFVIDPQTGRWTYTLDRHTPEVDALARGETRFETFQVTVSDEHGATAIQSVIITISGLEDNPVITSGVGHGRVLEDEVLTSTGVVVATDIDNNSVLTYSGNSDSPMGQFVIDPQTGRWTYTLDRHTPEVDALARGETRFETFQVTVSDEHGSTAIQSVIITISGLQDNPVITSDVGHGRVLAYETLMTVGTVTSTDVDHNSVLTYSGNNDSPMGQFVIDPQTGRWTYTLDNNNPDVQTLPRGETRFETFQVTVSDEHGDTALQSVIITIYGLYDAPPAISTSAMGCFIAENFDWHAQPTIVINGPAGDNLEVASAGVTGSDTTAHANVQGIIEVHGKYMDLFINAHTGEAMYVWNGNAVPDGAATENFTYTAIDANTGVTATNTFTAAIYGHTEEGVPDVAGTYYAPIPAWAEHVTQHYVYGTGGNDQLTGSSADDRLAAFSGDDMLTGDDGNDTFVWSLKDTGNDTITDFQVRGISNNTGNDVLDLRSMLNVAENASALDNYLHFSQDANGKVVIAIDKDGTGAAGVTQTVKLENVAFSDLASHAGGHSDQAIIQYLLNNGNLKTDA